MGWRFEGVLGAVPEIGGVQAIIVERQARIIEMTAYLGLIRSRGHLPYRDTMPTPMADTPTRRPPSPRLSHGCPGSVSIAPVGPVLLEFSAPDPPARPPRRAPPPSCRCSGSRSSHGSASAT